MLDTVAFPCITLAETLTEVPVYIKSKDIRAPLFNGLTIVRLPFMLSLEMRSFCPTTITGTLG